MENARWERIQELFHAAADLPAAEQRGFLGAQCGGDAGLMDTVLAMFDADGRDSTPLDRGVGEAARGVIANGSLPPPIAQQLGPYRVVKLLGEGGMGVVYLAERAGVGGLVAIKLLSDAWLSPARRARFAAEQRTLARLDHPGIARLYDAGALVDGTPFFVMEYVEGEVLTDHCRQRATSLDERLRLFRSLCEAVQFAHQHAVIHRDIKPSNVMVKRDGTVRLLDFGIAKQLEHVDAPSTQTRSGVRLMTPAYAAPEQLVGGPVGIYTDVYSLGVVLYELLAGQLPFERSSRTPADLMSAAAAREPARPSSVAAAAPAGVTASKSAWADLDVLVLTSMRAEPQRRYGSVDALIRDVDHYLRGEPLDARPDGAAYRVRKFVTRNRRPVLATVAAIAALIALVVFFTARLASARDVAVAEAARTQRVRDFMTRMLTGGDEDVGPGKDLRVITLLDIGAREARAMAEDPEVQADLFQTLGSLYQALGEHESADPLLRSALQRQRELHGEGGATVDAMVALGLLRDEQAQYAEAEQLFRGALDQGRRHLASGDPRAVRAAVALGRVLINRSRYADALPVLDEALRLQAEHDGSARDVNITRGILANAHYYLGHNAESYELNRRALEIDRQLVGENHPFIASDLFNLGAIQQSWGHHAEAEKLHRQALSIMESFYGRDNVEVGSGLTHVGRALLGQDKFAEATEVLNRALEIYERAYGKVHPRVAVAVGELGHLAVKQGRLDDAEALFRRQGDIYREVFDHKHHLHGLVRGNMASVAFERGDHAGAERLYRESLAGLRGIVAPEHPGVAIVEVLLARTLVKQKRFAEAEPHARAGLTVLARAAPDLKYAAWAREDLAAIREALGRPGQAAR